MGPDPVDLSFVRNLPADSIESLTLNRVVEASIGALVHLAPGLRKLYLAWTNLTDDALETVAGLTGLTWLQTFGNAFIVCGLQQLASLVNMVDLYLEEETRTLDAFAFVDQLSSLKQLRVQDVQLDDADLRHLRERLSPVRITT